VGRTTLVSHERCWTVIESFCRCCMDITSCVIMLRRYKVFEIHFYIMEVQLVRANKLLVYGYPAIKCNVKM